MAKVLPLLDLLPAFTKKMLHAWPLPAKYWSEQRWFGEKTKKGFKRTAKDVAFINMEREMTKQDLLRHFMQEKSIERAANGDYELGSLALKASYRDVVKFWCLDADDAERAQLVRDKLLPVLQKHGIEYVWEFGGQHMDRCHLWFFCTTTVPILKAFVDIIMKEAFGKKWMKHKFELYGSHIPDNVIRLPAGLHLRAGIANPIERDGVISSDPAFVMQAIIDCKPVSQAYMVEVISENAPYDPISKDPESPLAGWKRKNKGKARGRYDFNFKYVPRTDLKAPFPNAPPFVKVLSTQCQAIHKLYTKVKTEEFLEERGGDIHKGGVLLSGIAQFGAMKIAKTEEEEEEYEEFGDFQIRDNRFRNWFGHGWHRKLESSEINKAVWRCETIEKLFDWCKGCPYYKAEFFSSPRQLWYGDKVVVKKIKKLTAVTNEEVRETVFRKAKRLITKSLAKKGDELTLLIASGQGTGKSHMIDEVTAFIRKNIQKFMNKRILIAAPTGKIAVEHRDRLEDDFDEEALLLLSFVNGFELNPPKFGMCPYFDEIKDKIDAGVANSVIKSNYCKTCPHREDCNFANQYKKLFELYESKKSCVVICQHAHFRSKEVMTIFRNIGFDIMFIDETFVNNIHSYLKVSNEEKAIFRVNSKHFPWLKTVQRWLNAEPLKNKQKVLVPYNDLLEIKKAHDYHSVPYRLPEYIRLINEGHPYSKRKGIHKFYPLPNISRLVMTDATSTLDIVEMVINDHDIQVIGKNQLVDITRYNKRNKMIKIIDGSNSKAAQSDPDKVERILHFIGMKGMTDYLKLSILITCYKSDIELIKKFFLHYYPKLMPRLTISHMAIGINDYKNTNVQFLLCGVHFNALQYAFAEWEFVDIDNFWRRQNDEPEEFNPFPDYVTPGTAILTKEVPVKVKLLLNGKPYLVKIKGYYDEIPLADKQRLIHAMTLGMTQQAMRLRFHDEKLKIVYDWSKRYRPGILFTDIVLESQLLGIVDERFEEILD